MIDLSRDSPALTKFFTTAFEGTFITNFWSLYDAVACAEKQKCWPRLLRDVVAVDEAHQPDEQWKSLSRRLVGIYRDAKILHGQRGKLAGNAYDMSVARLEVRVSKLAAENWSHSVSNRLSKQLEKYGTELLTFFWHVDVPTDNKAARASDPTSCDDSQEQLLQPQRSRNVNTVGLDDDFRNAEFASLDAVAQELASKAFYFRKELKRHTSRLPRGMPFC
jgi:hypothetical protein